MRIRAGVEFGKAINMNAFVFWPTDRFHKLLDMCWLAQTSATGATATAADDLAIEQVWERPWPWSIWLTIIIATSICLAVCALYYSERGRASVFRRAALAGSKKPASPPTGAIQESGR